MDNNNPQNPKTNSNQIGTEPIQTQDPSNQEPRIRAVRTLEEDIRDAMQSKNMSQIKIAIAESEARGGGKTISNDPIRRTAFVSQQPKVDANLPKDVGRNVVAPKVFRGNFIPTDGPTNNLENSSVDNFQSSFNQQDTAQSQSQDSGPIFRQPSGPIKIESPVYEKVKTMQSDTFDSSKTGVGRMIQNKLDGTPDRPSPEENAQMIQSQMNMADQSIIQSQYKPFPWGKVLLSLLILIFLGGGGYGGYYIYSIQPKDKPANQKPTESILSILPADDNKKLVLVENTGDYTSKIKTLLSAPLEADKIRNIYIRKDNILRSGGSDITAQDFFGLVDINIPEQLSSSFKGDFMLGAYGDGQNNYPFLFIKVGFFQGALASMLRFEKDMRLEFTPLFVAESGISMGTTTDPRYNLKSFSDELIENKDVRILRRGASDQDTVILYSFIDQDNLIITTSEKSLKFLINLYGKRKIVR